MKTHRTSITRIAGPLAFAAALCGGQLLMYGSGAALAQSAPQPPAAQDQYLMDSQPMNGPLPDAWDSVWDNGTYDHTHYVIGTVASFTAYRLLVARGSGETMQIDLKKGTVIRPEGLDLAPGEHVAVVGYSSKGTFIANRVVLRRA
jgi:hypothetical protein